MSRRKTEKPETYVSGPWLGVKEQQDPAAYDPLYASEMVNLYPSVGPVGSAVITRPSLTRGSDIALGTPGQGVYGDKVADTVNASTFVFAGGKVYLYAWDFVPLDTTPGTVTISALAKQVYSVQFAKKIIVSDGINRPWKANSDMGSAAYLTGVPGALYGPPVVYYAKLFGIKANERDTIIWSEEVDPDTGYEAGGYNNSWTLSQTSTDDLTCLCATNEALYYFRRRSIGAISGAVNDDFVNAGVHDSVSTTVGTLSPAAVVKVGKAIWFLDERGRPHSIEGGQVIPRWEDAITSIGRGEEDALLNCWGTYNADLDLVLFAHTQSGTSTSDAPAVLLVYKGDTGQFLGTWKHQDGSSIKFSAGGHAYNPDHELQFLHLGATGIAYEMPIVADSARTVDTHDLVATPVGIEQTVVTGAMGSETRNDKNLQLAQITFRGAATRSVSVDYTTPRNPTSYSTTQTLSATKEQEAIGLNAHGRWMRLRLRHTTAAGDTARFGVQWVTVEGVESSVGPKIP